eukprot:TRINITY_DN64826_c0_g1_i1.p1 TRINITY_DN64826_c0_g1~~TRINITY_DN64826_c0_g1_i1.p1  ORF type:complete len:223 (-),score=46.79 TRINITY_DN64826_c0_g1_i1:124-792(-)
MSKFARFVDSCHHGGYVAGPTVVEGQKLDNLLPEFKSWFASIDGFGEYLRSYFEHYHDYFDEDVTTKEEHRLVYSQLHKEFSTNLEQSIGEWLKQLGLSEDDFGVMMQLASKRGDLMSDEIVGVLLGMLDYQLWIMNIFALRRSRQLSEILPPPPPPPPQMDEEIAQAQEERLLHVTVPEGVFAGQAVEVKASEEQSLTVTVPEGLSAGDVFAVSYIPAPVA